MIEHSILEETGLHLINATETLAITLLESTADPRTTMTIAWLLRMIAETRVVRYLSMAAE